MKEGLGKTYRGQQFVPIRSAEDVAQDAMAQAPHDVEGAVKIDVWFALRGHRDPVAQAAMRAFTRVQRATPEAWDMIFSTY